MDSADATPFGAWASIRGFFTPATLFIVVNFVIGTIALTSRSHQQRRRRDHHDEPLHPHQQQEYHYYQQQQPDQYSTPPPVPAPLARTSSVLDRLRSIGLYRFRSGDFPPEYGTAAPAANHDVFSPVEEETAKQQTHYARSRSKPAPAPAREEKRAAATRMKKSGSEVRKAQVARAQASRVVEAVAEDDVAVDARAEVFIGSFGREPSPREAEYHYQEEYVAPPAPAPLARTSSVLDRLRSMSIYGFLAPEQPAAARDGGFATPADEKKQTHAHYDRSRSEPAREQGKKEKKPGAAAEARMVKSSSVARKATAPSRSEAETDRCVDARAEAFINNFKRERSQQRVHHDQEEIVVPPPAPAPLVRTSSVLDRLRSFGQYLRSSDLVVPAPAPAEDGKKQAAAQYGRSRSEPVREQGKKEKKQASSEARMSKSSSEAAMAEEEPTETEQCVDAKADDFINKFRHQLQLQRLNSLLNYKEMLNGGGSKQ